MSVAPRSRRPPPPALRRTRAVTLLLALAACAAPAALAATHADPPTVAGIPVDFILFALTLLGVALFHHHTLQVALTGLAAITVYKLAFTGFKTARASPASATHIAARVGDPRQPVPAADRLRAAVAPFREEPRAGGAAARSCRTTGRARSSCW